MIHGTILPCLLEGDVTMAIFQMSGISPLMRQQSEMIVTGTEIVSTRYLRIIGGNSLGLVSLLILGFAAVGTLWLVQWFVVRSWVTEMKSAINTSTTTSFVWLIYSHIRALWSSACGDCCRLAEFRSCTT